MLGITKIRPEMKFFQIYRNFTRNTYLGYLKVKSSAVKIVSLHLRGVCHISFSCSSILPVIASVGFIEPLGMSWVFSHVNVV
jgi:hypothetical protein